MESYISFDLETTGFSAVSNEIIEIGAWKIQDGVAVSRFQELVKPKGYIPLDIQKMTHITADMVDDARGIEEVLPEFYTWCEDMPFLGHNLNFDFSFVFAKGKELGYDFSLDGNRCGICTLKLSREYFPDISHKLCDMATAFNIKLSVDGGDLSFHRAIYDAYMTKLVYDRFKEMYHGIPSIETPSKLLANPNQYGVAQSQGILSFK